MFDMFVLFEIVFSSCFRADIGVARGDGCDGWGRRCRHECRGVYPDRKSENAGEIGALFEVTNFEIGASFGASLCFALAIARGMTSVGSCGRGGGRSYPCTEMQGLGGGEDHLKTAQNRPLFEVFKCSLPLRACSNVCFLLRATFCRTGRNYCTLVFNDLVKKLLRRIEFCGIIFSM